MAPVIDMHTTSTFFDTPPSVYQAVACAPKPDTDAIVEDMRLQTISAMRLDNLIGGIDTYAHIISRLRQWENEEPEDDFVYAPTAKATERVERLLAVAYIFTSHKLSRPLISPDGQGGVVFEWQHEARDVKLIIPALPEHRPYLYHESGSEYSVENNLDAFKVAEWLNWLRG